MVVSVNNFRKLIWLSVLFVVLSSFIIWGQNLSWQFDRLSAYKWFPLFGLLAFGLMWTHYVVAASRQLLGIDKENTKTFFDTTSIAVLVAILLHPGLLISQLWRDGFGLPPDSYLNHYIGPGLKWAAMLGSISLVAFLIYELRYWLQNKSWWKFIQLASDLAMFAILIHGFRLGSHLQSGWFRWVWLFYALTLVLSLSIIYSKSGVLKGKRAGK